jgi:type IV pilus assembly protein PilQ
MNGLGRLLLTILISISLVRCASGPTSSDDVGFEGADGSSLDFEDGGTDLDQEVANNQGEPQSLEDELNAADGAPAREQAPAQEANWDQAQPADGGDEFAEFDEPAPPAEKPAVQAQGKTLENEFAQAETPPEDGAPEEFSQELVQDFTPPARLEEPAAPPVVERPVVQPSAPVASLVRIENFRYRANDNGGTLIVEANGPLEYTTRLNPETNQFVIEIPRSRLARKLKRPFNTRDMGGQVGAIDAYQNRGSTTSRIVVQLREGAGEPVVQPEGNSLLIVASKSAAAPIAARSGDAEASGAPDAEDIAAADAENFPEQESSILSAQSLEEFLAGNMQFFGRKISIETQDMDLRDVFRLIAEESGLNLILSDDIKGTISVKLRQVPWDQALVMIMKSKKLGYTRAGNILRIAPISDIKGEEDEAIRLATAKKNQAPLKVRMVPISYANVNELAAQVRPFMSDRGRVIGDTRTSALVIQDADENIERVLKLISSIDVPPPQVLIEGKVVEASDGFRKSVGVNWSASGQNFQLGRGRNPSGSAGFQVSPQLGPATFGLDFRLGTLDILGDLQATLALFEQEGQVKVISSPRILTLHNQPAEINQSTEIPLISTNQVPNAGSTTSVSFKPVRLKLQVTPQITNDGAVIMDVDVNREFVGEVVDQNTQARPVNSRSAKTKVLVRNGQTAVIGGIYQSDAAEGTRKVPWLGDVPGVGWLFKSRSKDTSKNELLIFLTPRILAQLESGAMPASQSAPEIEGGFE